MSTEPAFHSLFKDYYAIYETIYAILNEEAPLNAEEVELRVKKLHPEMGMGLETLPTAIKQALAHTPEASENSATPGRSIFINHSADDLLSAARKRIESTTDQLGHSKKHRMLRRTKIITNVRAFC